MSKLFLYRGLRIVGHLDLGKAGSEIGVCLDMPRGWLGEGALHHDSGGESRVARGLDYANRRTI